MKQMPFPFRQLWADRVGSFWGRNAAFPSHSLFGWGWEGHEAVLGTDLLVTSSKCQRYVPKLDLVFDATLPKEQSWLWNPWISLRLWERQQVVVCELSSDYLVITSGITLQPPQPRAHVRWQRSPFGERRGMPSGPSVCHQGSRGWGSRFFLHYWGCMALVVSLKLSSVAKSSSHSTDAFPELSSALPVSHPPTLAASCLQTDLLVKWRKPSLYAFVSGKRGGKPVFLEEGSWGCLDQENRVLFKKRRFYRWVAPSFLITVFLWG